MSMRSAPLACLVVLVSATAVLAAEATPDTFKAEREYVNRLLALENTAAANADLARWCAANGLADRAAVHWTAVIRLDPNNAEARTALGQVQRGNTWVPAAEAAPSTLKKPPQVSPPENLLARQEAPARDGS